MDATRPMRQLASGAAAHKHDKKERKRVQNRRNQQARRDRLRQTKEETSQRSFSVQRWRLNNDEDEDTVKRAGQLSVQQQLVKKSPRMAVAAAVAAALITPSPQADTLLHLINENVIRAFDTNKGILNRLVKDFYRDFPSSTLHMSEPQPCEGLIVTSPVADGIPVSLVPTALQRATPHSAWINVVPFPRMRDNLIRWHDGFDHWEFLSDMTGHIVDRGLITRKTHTGVSPPMAGKGGAYEARKPHEGDGGEESDEDDPLAEWNGAIVWGEPHRKENWEFTVHFMTKWAWVFEGCDEIVTVTNTWRRGRGVSLLRPGAVVRMPSMPMVEEMGA